MKMFMAEKSVAVEKVLSKTGWEGQDVPYTQTIQIDELKEDQNGIISVSQKATSEQKDAARDAMLTVTAQAAGSLTISCDGIKPDTVDIPVCVILLG